MILREEDLVDEGAFLRRGVAYLEEEDLTPEIFLLGVVFERLLYVRTELCRIREELPASTLLVFESMRPLLTDFESLRIDLPEEPNLGVELEPLEG